MGELTRAYAVKVEDFRKEAQMGSMTNGINVIYVDGVSITRGMPHEHIWTYASGTSDDYNYTEWNCPCAQYPGPTSPSSVITLNRVTQVLGKQIKIISTTSYGM